MTTSIPDRIVALVRHAEPRVAPDVPSSEWDLRAAGLRNCVALAETLCRFLPAILVSSTEPKAVQTARLIAQQLGLEMTSRDGLREHKRSGEFLPKSTFHSNIQASFANPTKVEFGRESCDELGLRIEDEVHKALSRVPDSNVMLVTHGTAMTSFIMRHWQVDPFEVWKSLGLPAYLAFTLPTFDIVGMSGVDASLFAKTAAGA